MNPSLARMALALGLAATAAASPALRIGLVGLDTSHCIAFTKLFNDASDPEHVAGARVVAAWKGGSPDIPKSASRVDGFTAQLQHDFGVPVYPTIEDVARRVDAIMILSLDGRVHLDEARRVFRFHKPVFVDKPFANTAADAAAIFRLAREEGAPCFSSSTERFTPDMVTLEHAPIGRRTGVICYGPAPTQPNVPNLFYYGIHEAEKIYTLMGRGCATVACTHAADTDVVTGTWSDGRVATLWGFRNSKAYAFKTIEFGTEALAEAAPPEGYRPMALQLIRFFRTGVAPVPEAETVEIIAFLQAADLSAERGGAPVPLAPLLPPTLSHGHE